MSFPNGNCPNCAAHWGGSQPDGRCLQCGYLVPDDDGTEEDRLRRNEYWEELKTKSDAWWAQLAHTEPRQQTNLQETT
jgi:hypothetical protein